MLLARRLILALGVLGIGLVTAMAADIPTKTPMAPPAPAYDWTGFYVGVSAGYGWGDDSGIGNAVSTFCNPAIVGCPAFGSATEAAIASNFATAPKGFIGGGQIGYNYQTGAFVWGVEADFSGADMKGSTTSTNTVASVGFPANPVTVTSTGNQKLDYLGTMRARVGWAANNPLLLYVTGGLAYGQVSADSTFTETLANCIACGPSPTRTGSASAWSAGWTIGGGLEWMFAPRWSLRAEYLYYDLGSVSYTTSFTQTVFGGVPFFGADVVSTADFKGSIARGGLNYKF